MNEDDEAAAWAQLESEGRHYNELLANDPGYHEWVERMNEERTNEIQCEGLGQF